MDLKKEEFKRNSINVHQRLGTDLHVTQEEMDQERTNSKAYDYLCRLEEAKSWIGRIADIPDSYEEFEEEMRKGVFLAEIAKFYSPFSVKSIFIDPSLQYRHTDNINFFLCSLKDLGLPKHFYFEVIDLYEKKNFPKVVYCIHALAHYLNTKGIAGGIESARGKVFAKSDLERLDSEIDKIKMPEFSKIQKDLDENIKKDSDEDDCIERLRREAEEELLRAGDEIMDEDIEENDIEEGEKEEVLTIEDKISLKIKTFLYVKAFDDIYYRKNVSLFSIKKFIFIFFKASNEMIKEAEIDELHKKINFKLKDINDKEMYLEDIENRVKLMISNKLELHNIKPRTNKVEEMNLKPLELVLHRLLTEPKYLSTLLFNVEDKESFINSTVLPIFSNVSGKKEEYLFINLVMDVLKMELSSLGINNLSYDLSFDCSILGQSSVAHLLMVCYFRSSKEGKVFRDGLYSIVRNLENIEVECNPSEIHKDLFSKEASMDVALENGKVKDLMKTRLMVVRGVLSSIVHFVESNIDNIPYILRYFFKIYGITNFFSGFISQFLLAPDAFNSDLRISKSLRSKAFKIVQLINFAIENPEYFGTCHFAGSINEENVNSTSSVSSRSTDPTNQQNINTQSISTNNDNTDLSYYAPIFPFLREVSTKFTFVLNSVTSVSTLDNYFQLESLNELVRVKKSVVYLQVK
ncbi:calponin domain containing protein, partial [Nosema bombycis CQ1]